jgi:uncharacterized repeat protein (TIGR04076 family)
MTLKLHIDGGARGNPGPAAAGVVIHDEDDRPRFEAGYFLGRATNNQAEYRALLIGLDAVDAMRPDEIMIYSDSELLVKQLTGEYRMKSELLAPLLEQAQHVLLRYRWHARHVPREKNKRADELVNLALDRRSDVILIDERGVNTDKPIGGNGDAASGGGAGETAIAEARGPDVVVVARTASASDAVACPAPCRKGQRFEFTATMPAGLCVMACRSMLQTVLSMQHAGFEPDEPPPPVTVRCTKPKCGAMWELTCRTR